MRFEPGDFEPLVGYHSEIADKIAERANAILAEWLGEAPKTEIDWDPRWSGEEIDRHLDQKWDGRRWICALIVVEEVRRW